MGWRARWRKAVGHHRMRHLGIQTPSLRLGIRRRRHLLLKCIILARPLRARIIRLLVASFAVLCAGVTAIVDTIWVLSPQSGVEVVFDRVVGSGSRPAHTITSRTYLQLLTI
eukprot:1190861-Prorocentrum_minimum.AAC.1